MARGRQNGPPTTDGPAMNGSISAPQVRCIGPDGAQMGILALEEALRQAAKFGLDLVELQPSATPPVCKILDYGKHKYQAQKRASEARKKQKIVDLKEIKFRPNIDSHDYDVKMRAVRKFLSAGDKVKITLRFRGREMAHIGLGTKLLERVRDDIGEEAKIESMPKMEGRQMIMLLAPK